LVFEAVLLLKNVVMKDLRACVDYMVFSIKFNFLVFWIPELTNQPLIHFY